MSANRADRFVCRGQRRRPLRSVAAIGLFLAVSAQAEAQPRTLSRTPGATTVPVEAPTRSDLPIVENKGAYLTSGVAKRVQRKYREAIDDLTIYVFANDRDDDGHWELGLAHALYYSARPVPAVRKKAIDSLRRSFELNPSVARQLPPDASAKAEVVAIVKEARQAAGVAAESPASRAVNAEGLLRVAESQIDNGDLFEGKKNYDEVKTLPPPPPVIDRERVRTKLDNALRSKIQHIQTLEGSDLGQAQDEAGKIVKFFPDEPIALETYLRLQQRYSKITMEGLIGQKLYQSYKNNIEGFLMKGQYKDALGEVNRLLFNFPRSEFGERTYADILQKNEEALNTADEAFKEQRYGDARQLFELIRANYPDPGTAQDAISEIDEVRRKLEAGLERAQERDDFVSVYQIAKELSSKFPSHSKAQEAVKAALADVGARVNEGNEKVDAGLYVEAIERFRKALSVVPEHTSAEAGLAKARAAIREAKKKLWATMEIIPDGTFVLGGGPYPDTKPKDKAATLPEFAIDRYKVSNADYHLFLRAVGGKAPESWKEGSMEPEKADLPVSGVTQAEAESFCRWIGKRLPTEFEWEKAARGPAGLDLPYESAPGRVRKQFNAFKDYPVNQWPELASPYKVEGLIGPVFEWTSSSYVPYTGKNDSTNANAPRGAMKVLRGGSKSPSAPPSDKPLEATWREKRKADRRDPDLGFRCAASSTIPPEWLASDAEPEKVRDADAPAPSATSAPAAPAKG